MDQDRPSRFTRWAGSCWSYRSWESRPVALPSSPIEEMARSLMRSNLGDDTAWTRVFRDWLLKTTPAPEEG